MTSTRVSDWLTRSVRARQADLRASSTVVFPTPLTPTKRLNPGLKVEVGGLDGAQIGELEAQSRSRRRLHVDLAGYGCRDKRGAAFLKQTRRCALLPAAAHLVSPSHARCESTILLLCAAEAPALRYRGILPNRAAGDPRQCRASAAAHSALKSVSETAGLRYADDKRAARRGDNVVGTDKAVFGRNTDSALPHPHLVEYDITRSGRLCRY